MFILYMQNGQIHVYIIFSFYFTAKNLIGAPVVFVYYIHFDALSTTGQKGVQIKQEFPIMHIALKKNKGLALWLKLLWVK